MDVITCIVGMNKVKVEVKKHVWNKCEYLNGMINKFPKQNEFRIKVSEFWEDDEQYGIQNFHDFVELANGLKDVDINLLIDTYWADILTTNKFKFPSEIKSLIEKIVNKRFLINKKQDHVSTLTSLIGVASSLKCKLYTSFLGLYICFHYVNGKSKEEIRQMFGNSNIW